MSVDDMDPPIARAIEAFNGRDLDALMAEWADGGTFVDPLEPEGIPADEFRAYCADLLVAFPDFHTDVERVMTDDAGATAFQCTYTGTHRGSMEGIPPTGNAISIPAVSVVTVEEDGVTYWRDYWDQQAFAEQLGLTFPAILPKLPGILAGMIRSLV